MFSVCLFQGYREVVIGRVDNVDRRERDAPVPAGGAAAAGAQRRAARALARRLPAQEDRYAGTTPALRECSVHPLVWLLYFDVIYSNTRIICFVGWIKRHVLYVQCSVGMFSSSRIS